jgi:hypothetical protein
MQDLHKPASASKKRRARWNVEKTCIRTASARVKENSARWNAEETYTRARVKETARGPEGLQDPACGRPHDTPIYILKPTLWKQRSSPKNLLEIPEQQTLDYSAVNCRNLTLSLLSTTEPRGTGYRLSLDASLDSGYLAQLHLDSGYPARLYRDSGYRNNPSLTL